MKIFKRTRGAVPAVAFRPQPFDEFLAGLPSVDPSGDLAQVNLGPLFKGLRPCPRHEIAARGRAVGFSEVLTSRLYRLRELCDALDQLKLRQVALGLSYVEVAGRAGQPIGQVGNLLEQRSFHHVTLRSLSDIAWAVSSDYGSKSPPEHNVILQHFDKGIHAPRNRAYCSCIGGYPLNCFEDSSLVWDSLYLCLADMVHHYGNVVYFLSEYHTTWAA